MRIKNVLRKPSKAIVAIVLAAALSIGFAVSRAPSDGHEPVLGNGTDGAEENYTPPPEDIGLPADGAEEIHTPPPENINLPSMWIDMVSPSGLWFFFENPSYREYLYGSDYSLLVRAGDEWQPVEPIIDNAGFTSEAYSILPYSNTKMEMKKIDWQWWLGELPDGEYRFQKNIMHLRGPGDFDVFALKWEFTLAGQTVIPECGMAEPVPAGDGNDTVSPPPDVTSPAPMPSRLVSIEEWDGISADALELIYQDGDTGYYLSSIRSGNITLTFEDGERISLSEALSRSKVSIDELISNGLSVIIIDGGAPDR